MTADDAFDKLAEKNALNIPVAKARVSRNTEPLPIRGGRKTVIRRRSTGNTAIRQKADDVAETIRVLDILDSDDIGDYKPRGYEDDSAEFTTPTETDLEAVAGQITSAQAHGARVLGRDVDPDDFFDGLDDDSDNNIVDIVDADDEVSEAYENIGKVVGKETVVDATPVPEMQSVLDKARRLRRFSYLPLDDMDHFKTRARDIMASLSSQTPGRASLAVTSVERGSGQAELAIRLALAAAKKVDYRVLLADFDVRKPQVAKRLGLSSKYFTLTDVLRESCPLGEALMMSEEDNLYVLPARESDRAGDEVLNDRQVQTLMGKFHETFDFVVISCGPMDHADAMIIGRHAGAAALAGFCGYSSARALRGAARRLSEGGVNVAGLLLAGAW